MTVTNNAALVNDFFLQAWLGAIIWDYRIWKGAEMLRFNGAWRFTPPPDGQWINQTIPSEAVEEFYLLITRTATQGNRQEILEHFKGAFCTAIGSMHVWSSNESWAETDLRSCMGQAAENAPLFIEAFYDACESLSRVNKEYYAPDVALINAVCQKHRLGYEIRVPDLVFLDSETSDSSIAAQGVAETSVSMGLRDAVFEKEKNRHRLLLTLYEMITERGDCQIPRAELVHRSGLDPVAARAAESYLEGEGLLEVKTFGPDGGIEITHQGIVEIEDRLKSSYTSTPNPPTGTSQPLSVVGKSMSPPTTRRLRVFLCHSSSDKPAVRNLYHRLCRNGIDPWLDEENLLPGQDWQQEIPKAVRNSDVVVVCLSQGAINKAGYLQKEIRYALDVADEQPEGTIFLIPLKLEECDVPDRLNRWQWVNFFDERGYDRLMLALSARAANLEQ